MDATILNSLSLLFTWTTGTANRSPAVPAAELCLLPCSNDTSMLWGNGREGRRSGMQSSYCIILSALKIQVRLKIKTKKINPKNKLH